MIKKFNLTFPDAEEVDSFMSTFNFELLNDIYWRYVINAFYNSVDIYCYGKDTNWEEVENTLKSYCLVVISSEVDFDDIKITNELTPEAEMQLLNLLSKFSVNCIRLGVPLDASIVHNLFSMRYDEGMQTVEILRNCVDVLLASRMISMMEGLRREEQQRPE